MPHTDPAAPIAQDHEPPAHEGLYPHALVVCQGPCRALYPHSETVLVNNGVEERRSCYDCLPAVCELASAFPQDGSAALDEVA